MKKAIVLAGTSFALAALPAVGVFAGTSSVTDNFTVNLSETCAISRTGAAASAVSGASSALDFGTTTADTYTATLIGGKAAAIGTSTFTVTCNDTTKGHDLAVQFTGLNGSVAGAMIPYDGSAAAADGVARWNATTTANAGLGVSAALITATETGANTGIYNGVVYSNSKTAVSGTEFTVTYNVSTAASTPAATYTGSAAYTLTYGV